MSLASAGCVGVAHTAPVSPRRCLHPALPVQQRNPEQTPQPPFLAVAPWHSLLHQPVGLGIKNRPAHIFLGLNFPARLWLVFQQTFSSPLVLSSSKQWSVMPEWWAGVLTAASLPGASAAALQEQEPTRVPAPVGGHSGALLAAPSIPAPFAGFRAANIPPTLPTYARDCSFHPGWISAHSPSLDPQGLLPPVAPIPGSVPAPQREQREHPPSSPVRSILPTPEHPGREVVAGSKRRRDAVLDTRVVLVAEQAGRAWERERERAREPIPL